MGLQKRVIKLTVLQPSAPVHGGGLLEECVADIISSFLSLALWALFCTLVAFFVI